MGNLERIDFKTRDPLMHRRKLVVLSLPTSFGGGEFYLKRLTELLKAESDIVICSTDVGGLLEGLAESGATIVRFNNSTWIHARWNLLVWAWCARRALRKPGVLILYNGIGPAYFAPILWGFLRVKGVLIAHTPTSLWRGLLRRSVLFVVRRFLAAVIGVSDTVAADISGFWPGMAVFSIPNWLSPAEFVVQDGCRARGKAAEIVSVVVASRLAPGKGIEHVLSVCADLPAILRLDVYGDGQLLPILRGRYGHMSHIQFHGMVTDIQRRLKSHDILITASSIDTFSYSTAEGILHGLLCVVTKTSVFRELLGDDYPESLMFNYGDEVDLLRAISCARNLLFAEGKYVDRVIAQAQLRIQGRNNSIVAKRNFDRFFMLMCK